jgi:hypothetical protein
MTRRTLCTRLVGGALISVAVAAGAAFVMTKLRSDEVVVDLVSAELAFFGISKQEAPQALSIQSGLLRHATEIRLGPEVLWKQRQPRLNQLDLEPPDSVSCRGLDLALRYEGGTPVQWVLEIEAVRRSGQPLGADPSCPWTLLSRSDGDSVSRRHGLGGGPLTVAFERPHGSVAVLGTASAASVKSGPLLLRRKTTVHPQLATGPDGVPGFVRMAELSAEELLDDGGNVVHDQKGRPRPALVAHLLVDSSTPIVVNGSRLSSVWLAGWVSLFASVAVVLFGILIKVLGLLGCDEKPASAVGGSDPGSCGSKP